MKRKYTAIIYLLLLSIGTILNIYMPKHETKANDAEAVVIPSDAIRLRILANSDSAEDQALKRLVRDEVNEEITKWVAQLTSKEEAREVIQAGLPEIERIAKRIVAEQKAEQEVKVEFGLVDFPTKLYGEFLYPAGKYEAILITLGEGKGANWWCVLFPPLCFLDFSNGVAVSEGFDEAENMVKAAEFEQGKTEKREPKEETAKVAPEKEEPVTEVENEAKAASEENVETPVEEKIEEPVPAKEENEDVNEKPVAETEEEPVVKQEKQAPVFAAEEEEDEVEVKFFFKEVWNKIFG